MTINEEIFDNVFTWVDQVLNQERCMGVTIVQSHQDIPKPTEDQKFITVHYSNEIDRIGRANKGEVNEYGKRNLINEYIGTLELRESNGDGELLRILLDSIERQEIMDLWTNLKLVHYTDGPIIPIPRIPETEWQKESIVEMTIGYATVTEEKVGLIEDVNITGTVSAQGREGNHDLDNKN